MALHGLNQGEVFHLPTLSIILTFQVKTACNGIEVVFHCATAAPTGSNALNKSLMDGVNIEGTRNIVAGCQVGIYIGTSNWVPVIVFLV